jgi:hypothetical protein
VATALLVGKVCTLTGQVGSTRGVVDDPAPLRILSSFLKIDVKVGSCLRHLGSRENSRFVPPGHPQIWPIVLYDIGAGRDDIVIMNLDH